MAQKLAQLQPFIAVFPQECVANLHDLGQPNTLLAQGGAGGAAQHDQSVAEAAAVAARGARVLGQWGVGMLQQARAFAYGEEEQAGAEAGAAAWDSTGDLL